MATFSFDTMTAAQAAAFSGADFLTFDTGTAPAVTVLFNGSVTTVSLGAHSLDFSSAVSAVSQFGGVSSADHSLLYIGDFAANTEHLASDSTTPAAMFGADGDDTLITGLGGGLLQGNQGADTLETAGKATIYGGQGNDTIAAISNGSHDNFFQGNKGDDSIVGSIADDTLLGGQGNDTVLGNGGVDFINGNLGNDNLSGSGQLFGEGGDDTISSRGPGSDTLSGGDGNDSLTAQGDDSISGDAGDDRIQGSQGGDTLNGGAGNDTIDGSGGPDRLFGGGGSDTFVFTTVNIAAGSFPAILDWSADDTLSLKHGLLSPSDFLTTTAPDFASAITVAENLFHADLFTVVAVQVGSDVIVFGGEQAAGFVFERALDLVGRSLADISFHNLI